jgi:glycosyltransferase involved in cell wall biosynthesis
LRVRLEDQARGLPVVFAGFMNQRQMARAYAAANALALASDHGETWGLVVNEAMACGLPAFVSNQVGCAEDLILPGETGEVYACGDPSGLAEKLALYTDGERLRRMGARARQRVGHGFHFARVVDGVRRAVEAVA